MEDNELFDLATHWAEQAQAQASIAADSARAVKAALRRLAQRASKIDSRWGDVKGAFAVEPDYKAVLEKIKIIIDDMPQMERWFGAMEAAKGFKQIHEILKDIL